MRAYFFVNMHISGIHAGIQAGHANSDLLVKYSPVDKNGNPQITGIGQSAMAWAWARNHKTYIILNGGNSDSMYALRRHLESIQNPYPWTYFKEPGLANVITAICIILPESIYVQDTYGFEKDEAPEGIWLQKFLEIKARCPLAQ
jgi:hypothetical protein